MNMYHYDIRVIDVIHLLKQVSLFKKCKEDELKHVEAHITKRTYPVGTLLCRQGERDGYLYMVADGSVKIYHENSEGKEKVITIFKAGDYFGELEIIDNVPRSASVCTVEQSTILSIKREAFLLLLEQNSTIARNFLKELVARLRKTNQQIEDLVFLDANTRVVKTFVNLAKEYGERNHDLIKINVKVSVFDIANLAGIPFELAAKVVQFLYDKAILQVRESFYYLNAAAFYKNHSGLGS